APTPASLLKIPTEAAWRYLTSVATSSQNRTTRTRMPAARIVAQSASICVLFPAPSIPEKLISFGQQEIRRFFSDCNVCIFFETTKSFSLWRLAWSSAGERQDSANGDASADEQSDANQDRSRSPLLGRRNYSTRGLEAVTPAAPSGGAAAVPTGF